MALSTALTESVSRDAIGWRRHELVLIVVFSDDFDAGCPDKPTRFLVSGPTRIFLL